MTPARRRALLLAGLAFAIYNLNLRVVGSGDSRPARLLPFVLWSGGGVTLDTVAELSSRVPPELRAERAYWQWRSPSGRLLSMYPIVTPVAVTPLYAPAAAALWLRGGSPGELAARWGGTMEKLAASGVAALSVGLVCLLLAGRLGRRDATLFTVAYAFGTGTWAISSQALWQHGLGELLVVAALLGLERLAGRAAGGDAGGGARGRMGWVAAGVGAVCGLMVANRPPDGLLAVALLVGAGVAGRVGGGGRGERVGEGREGWVRRRAAVGAAALAAAPWIAYNLHFFGRLAGGYAVMGLAGAHSFYRHSMLAGAAGLLVSPAKGLLLFSPFFLVLPLAAAWAGRGREGPGPAGGAGAGDRRWLAVCVAGGLVAQLLFYGMSDWRAGFCYGPRFLTDAMPAAIWLVAPGLARVAGWPRRLVVAAVAFAVAVQAVGAFCYPQGDSDEIYYPRNAPRHLAIPAAVWDPANLAYLVEARGGLAPPW